MKRFAFRVSVFFFALALLFLASAPVRGQCPGGRCPLPARPQIAATPPAAAIAPVAVAPAGLVPPGPGFEWRFAPGVGGSYGGYGWVQAAPPAAPVGSASASRGERDHLIGFIKAAQRAADGSNPHGRHQFILGDREGAKLYFGYGYYDRGNVLFSGRGPWKPVEVGVEQGVDRFLKAYGR